MPVSGSDDAVLAAMWREVARHEPIGECTVALTALLRRVLPTRFVIVRRLDVDRARIETVASVDAPPGLEARSPLPSPRRDTLDAWARAGEIEAWPSRDVTAVARMCVPEGVAAAVVAGPLRSGDRVVGVLVVGVTGDGAGPTVDVAGATVRSALEPFAVALANDQRMHEIARLREAAVEDRTALLSRLARQDVSDAIVGAEHGLREVLARVGQVAPTDAPVLILGETGAGKEVLARTIHARSRRAGGPFLKVNCGAIPPDLVDSELFGHDKGSFTGAIAQRKGWFERADGGTLFLDEVAELPAAVQVRLLRVLQDGSFERVGGQQALNVDVRVVAATHRDLAGMVRDGRFRQDLWYRISVFPILLPALRERVGDIAALAQYFAERAGVRLFGRALAIDADGLARLQAYDWPGNVRELAAVIERAAILGNGHELPIARALGVSALGTVPASRGRTSAAPSGGVTESGRGTGEDRAAVEAMLQRCHGRIEGPFGAAAALGVNPHTLRSRMRKLGIAWGQFRGR